MPKLKLTLIRHAKASAEHRGDQRDFDRPLAERGERDVERMGERLAAAGLRPDLVVSSAAKRALQTARAIAGRVGHPAAAIVVRDDLYLASARTLLDAVREAGPEVRHQVLVGHNPGLGDLWDWLAGDGGAVLPTCGIVRLELSAERWADVEPGCAVLLDFDHPKRDRGEVGEVKGEA